MSNTHKNISTILVLLTSLQALSQVDDFFDTPQFDDFENECTRRMPEAVLDKSCFMKHHFELINHVGFEYVDLAKDERLIIRNSGCEYYTLTLRFEIKKNSIESYNVSRWYREIPKRLSQVAKKSNGPLDFQEATNVLINYIDNYDNHPLKMGKEISIVDGEIPIAMSFDKVLEKKENEVALELSIWIGPL